MLDPSDLTRVRAVLDWEMATLGDPLMDLGSTLAYWAQADDPPELKMFGVTHLPGNLDRRGVVARYAEKTGRDVSGIAFHPRMASSRSGDRPADLRPLRRRQDAGPTLRRLLHVVRAAAAWRPGAG